MSPERSRTFRPFRAAPQCVRLTLFWPYFNLYEDPTDPPYKFAALRNARKSIPNAWHFLYRWLRSRPSARAVSVMR
jgi:hypothetical protein